MRINVLKYEFYILMKNKTLIISVLALFFILIGIIIAYSFSYSENKVLLTSSQQEEAIAHYRERRELCRIISAYQRGEAELPEGIMLAQDIDYQRQYEYYDYLLQTQTFEEDYRMATRARIVCERALTVLGSLLPAIVILFSCYLLTIDSAKGREKNLRAAPMPQKSILCGRAMSIWCGVAVITVLFGLCPFVAALCDKSAFIAYGNNGYYAKPTFTALFLPAFASMALAASFWTGVTLLCARIKYRYWMIAIPLGLYVIMQTIYVILQESVDADIKWRLWLDAVAFLRYAPTFERIEHFGHADGWGALGVACAMALVVGVISFVVYTRGSGKGKEVCDVTN